MSIVYIIITNKVVSTRDIPISDNTTIAGTYKKGTTKNIPNVLNNIEKLTRGIFTGVAHAMKNKPQTIVRDSKEFKCVFPTLKCRDCNLIFPETLITYGEDKYYDHFMNTTAWFDSDLVASFGSLLFHSTHHKHIVFVDCAYPMSSDVTDTVKLNESVHTIVAVGHSQSHYSLIHINLEKHDVIVFDGIGSIPLSGWFPHVRFILNRCDIDPNPYISSVRHHTKDDYGGMQIVQDDGHNCGPIACRILWHTFLPNEVNVNVRVKQFRSLVIPKMKLLIQDAIASNKLLVKSREKLLDLSSEDNQNKSMLKVETKPAVCGDKHENDDELSPAHREKIKLRIESDMKRKRKQEEQGEKMKKRFKDSINCSIGNFVNLKVDIRDRNSTIPRGVVGVIAKVATTRSGNSAIYTRHGLLGSKQKYIMFSPNQYTVIKNPTLTEEMKELQSKILHPEFDIHSKKHNIISVSKAHKLEYKTNEEKVIRGECKCGFGKKGKIKCDKRCGCYKKNMRCSSACLCSNICPNRK